MQGETYEDAYQESEKRLLNWKPSICKQYMVQWSNKLLDDTMLALADILQWTFEAETIVSLPEERWINRIRPIAKQSEPISEYMLMGLSYISFSHISENIQIKLNYKYQILIHSKNLTKDEIQTLTILKDCLVRSVQMMDLNFFNFLCLDECTREIAQMIDDKMNKLIN